ncbi:MAG: hypothetical protein SFZ24_11645 [Planctomycetota bacterium]|nr:hypothetical protein [Planctomycetota bacterium]
MSQHDSSPPHDPFALLQLPRTYAIDRAALTRAWLTATARLHPDRPDAPDDAARALAVINLARAELEDDERRAAALLALSGGPSKETDQSLPGGFLVEMLETREQAEWDIQNEGDAARTRWGEWAEQRRAAHRATVTDLFSRHADAPPDSPAAAAILRDIRRELNAWRYIERMLEELAR